MNIDFMYYPNIKNLMNIQINQIFVAAIVTDLVYICINFFVLYVDVRLVPLDNRPYSGRVEVFFNNEWGQVCLDLLRTQASQVVCSQIGYPSTMSQTFPSDLPYNDSRVWIYDLDCTGTESTLLDCPSDVEYHIGKVYETCYEAAGVTCLLGK